MDNGYRHKWTEWKSEADPTHSHFGGDFQDGAFAYVRIKSPMFAYFEKKYFFRALWSSSASTPRIGDVLSMRVGAESGGRRSSEEGLFALEEGGMGIVKAA